MNWEPMTEEAMFEDCKEYITARCLPKYGIFNVEKMVYADGSFWLADDEYDREVFTHFARITNPNEEKP